MVSYKLSTRWIFVLPAAWLFTMFGCGDSSPSGPAMGGGGQGASGAPAGAGGSRSGSSGAGNGGTNGGGTTGSGGLSGPSTGLDASPGNGGSSAGAGGASGSGGAGNAGTGGARPDAGGARDAGATGSGGSGAGVDAGATGAVPLDPSLLSRCINQGSITCTINVPNGNYNVTVELGDPSAATTSWVQAETRRISVPATSTPAGMFSQQTFSVNVRQEIHDGGQAAAGNILNLLIGGAAPQLHGLGVAPAPTAVTLFIASDSTAADWEPTNTSALGDDERGWAQELTQFMKPGLAVANYADSGETAGSFYTRFWPAARALLKAGDYVFIQFGHNDQKIDLTLYQPALLNYINDARAARATPVLLTPVARRTASAADPGFAGLDQQVRDLATAENVDLIDLTMLSIAYYRTVPSLPALFATLTTGGNDSTHFSETGATQIAGLVAGSIKTLNLPLSTFAR